MANTANFVCDVRKRTGESKSQIQSTDNKHNNQFVVSYKNQFYNIKDFLRYHPGGTKILNFFKNRSLDKAFEENPHSKAAFHLLQDYMLNNQEKYQKYENLIDWNQAILGQVGSLGQHYSEWINLPVNRDVKLFESNILESLTITPWYMIPIIWIPVCLHFLYTGWTCISTDNIENTVFKVLISYIFGILLWTLLEYVLHREVFHYEPPANSKILITLHFLLHGVHHKAPFDSRRLVFPILPAALTTKVLLIIYNMVFPQTIVYFIIAGTVTGYVFYDLTHYYLHYGAPKDGTYMYLMKRNHNYHHYLHHDLGFGITSKLWDYMFRTNICLRKLTKPIEW